MRKVAVATAALLLLVIFLRGRAGAVEYELSIDVESEDDLYELLAAQEISEETFNSLVELLRKGVDLNTADVDEIYALPGLTMKDAEAIITYRVAAGGISDPGGLVLAGVLTEDKLLSIAPFLLVSKPEEPGFATTGRVRYRALVTASDGRLPAMSLEGRVDAFRHLTAGVVLLLTRNLVGDVRYDPTRDALSAEPRSTSPRLAKLYLAWKTKTFDVMAGTFHAGFGQRLTFDVSPVYTPNGLYIDNDFYRSTDLVSGCVESAGELPASPCSTTVHTYVTPDYRFRPGLFGLGARAKKIPLGEAWLEATGFVSRQLHDIYQYEIYDRARCDDPNQDNLEDCKAPPVYVRGDDLLMPETKFKFVTLPDMWAELLGGGNISVFGNRRSHVGVTGWGAKPTWLSSGMDLDFQEWSAFPRGGAYGAAGADAAWGRDWLDLAIEGTRTFDKIDGGDFGVLSRATITTHKSELELSLRWYGQDFVNPHTGAIAEPDETDGQRARDEAGARVRYGAKLTRRFSLRGLADLWEQPSTKILKLRAEVRGDYIITRQIEAGLFTRFNDKDLSEGGRGQCYEIPYELNEDGEPIPCKGLKLDVGAIGRLTPLKRMMISLQGQLRLIDDEGPSSMRATTFRRDIALVARLNWWATSLVRLLARVRWDKYDLGGIYPDLPSYLQQQLWGYLEAQYRIPRLFMIGARYEIRVYPDAGSSSYIREPSPEHWFQLELDAKF